MVINLDRYKNFFIIFALGISAGLPLSLILSTLKATLFEIGFDLATIGFLSLLSLPYSLKLIVAPLIDYYSVPILSKKIGHRKSWIMLNQLAMAGSCFLLAIAVAQQQLFLIIASALLIAIFSACQDIVIDAYRIEIFTGKDQGFATMLYIYGYRLGMLFSGGLALFLASKISWQAVYVVMVFAILFLAIFTVFATESKDKQFLHSKQNLASAWLFICRAYRDFLQKNNWHFVLLFIIFFKLTDAFAGSMIMPFLLDIGYSKQELAVVLKTFGLFATLGGVFVGAILVKKINLNKILYLAVILQAVSNFAFFYLAKFQANYFTINFLNFGFDLHLLIAVLVENISGGIGDVVFVAYLSSLCNKQFSATQYALFSSLGSLARSLLSSSSGLYATHLGWSNFFIFSVFLVIPALIFLAILNKKSFNR